MMPDQTRNVPGLSRSIPMILVSLQPVKALLTVYLERMRQMHALQLSIIGVRSPKLGCQSLFVYRCKALYHLEAELRRCSVAVAQMC